MSNENIQQLIKKGVQLQLKHLNEVSKQKELLVENGLIDRDTGKSNFTKLLEKVSGFRWDAKFAPENDNRECYFVQPR